MGLVCYGRNRHRHNGKGPHLSVAILGLNGPGVAVALVVVERDETIKCLTEGCTDGVDMGSGGDEDEV
jgi:hypothetical protein